MLTLKPSLLLPSHPGGPLDSTCFMRLYNGLIRGQRQFVVSPLSPGAAPGRTGMSFSLFIPFVLPASDIEFGISD